MKFWLDLGVDGFRLDAIPYLVERDGTHNENLPETHQVIKQIRAELDRLYAGKMLLAEANQWPEDVREYFGDGDECHMAYHFPMMPRLYMSIAMEDRYPLVEIMAQTPSIPSNCQWAIFLRNHDELTLEMVTDRERDYMYRIFANDPRMRVNVGIRRRLAPLMENDRRKIELITFLLMTMPGAPILYYGDEIGMGDNIYLGDRNGVRTPMQWTPDRNAGFSRADPQRLYLPPIMDPVYGFQGVNVESQQRSPSSLLNWTRRLIATRARYQAFGRGALCFLEPGNRKILAFLREHEGEAMLCVANLARDPQAAELDLSRFERRVPVELFGQEPFPPIGKLPYFVTLPGYGYMVFRLATDMKPPAWHEERLVTRRIPVLVLDSTWEKAFDTPGILDVPRAVMHASREKLRDEVLLPYLKGRRWFGAKNEKLADVRLDVAGAWRTDAGTWRITFVVAQLASGEVQRYFLPLALDWERRDHDPNERYAPFALAKVRHKDRVGLVYAAFADPRFARDMARAMLAGQDVPLGHGVLRFTATKLLAENEQAIDDEVRVPALEQSNTAVFFGNRLFLKGYRRMREGTNPELELGLFLTDVSPFPNIAPILGAIEYCDKGQAEPITLVVMQKFVENQGDLWTLILQHLSRMLTLPVSSSEAAVASPAESAAAGFHLGRMALLGRRVGEMHKALAVKTGDAKFDPEPVTAQDLDHWKQAIAREAEETFKLAERSSAAMPEAGRQAVTQFLERRDRILQRVASSSPALGGLAKTRFHGDLHLGQVLAAQDDFIIVDFEGEPGRSLEERRAKGSVLRDVAGMVRSFSYAAYAAAQKRETGAVVSEAGEKSLAQWEREAIHHFLEGYLRATEGVASVPAQREAFDALLGLFLMEKALYELRYEIANRPDWIGIPLRGLLELTQ
jgi:maltose alpha-D-glucosyltransferase/alpha-amylase